jgi:hypothetical protein
MPRLEPCTLHVYPPGLKDKESKLHGKNLDQPASLENHDLRVGVALSGGGVRSATFSLGVLQGLAKLKLLRYVGYLSTVSGGGYMGGFVGRLFLRDLEKIARRECKAATKEALGFRPIYAVEGILGNPRSRPLAFLRRNGRYLTPAGSGDLLTAVAVTLRNWISVLVVMGALALALLAVLSLVRYAAWPVDFDNPQGALPSPLYWPALWVFGLLAVPLGWSYWLTPAPVDALRWPFRWSSPILLAGALMWWSFLESESVPDGWLTQVRIVAFLPVLAMLYYVGVALFVRIRLRLAARRKAGEHLLEEADAISEIRYSLSILLKFGLVFTAALLFVWLIDTLGVLVYLLAVGYLEIAAASYVAITLLSLLARKGAMALTLRGPKEGRPPISVNVLAHLAAVLLVVAILSLIHAITHAIAWESAGASNGRGSFVSPLAVVAVIALVLSLLMGRVWAFVNRSTLHPLYESRDPSARGRRHRSGGLSPGSMGRPNSHPQRHGQPDCRQSVGLTAQGSEGNGSCSWTRWCEPWQSAPCSVG